MLNKINIKFPYWKAFTDSEYPTLAYSENERKCYFNFTALRSPVVVGFYQDIDLRDFSYFIDSGEAEVYMKLESICTNGSLQTYLGFYSVEGSRISLESELFLCTHS